MSEATETLADIVRAMRNPPEVGTSGYYDDYNGDTCYDSLKIWADRIEAAAVRERDEDRQLAAIAESDEAFARCARCDRPERATGNAAAMREALHKISETIWSKIDPTCKDDCCKPWRELAKIADAAIKGETK